MTDSVTAADTLPMGLMRGFGVRNGMDVQAGALTPELAHQLVVLATVWDETHDAIVLTDAANRIISVNPAFERITGYTEHEVLGHTPAMLASGRHPPSFYAAMWVAIQAQGRWEGEVLNRRKDGSVYPERLRITALLDPRTGDVVNYLATFADLSQQKAAQRKAVRLASFDQLTGLPNQMLLRDRAGQAIAQAQDSQGQVALLVLDLDHFKAVNDSLGHAGGDELLRQISQALAAVASATETLSRRGGDEFVFLFPHAERTDLRLMAQRVLLALADPFTVNGREAVVSASVGVAVYPTDGVDFDTLLNNAESAMYQAKDAGRRCARFFTEEMNQGARDRMALVGDLARATKRGELRLHYQPLVNLVTSEVIGAEALVRWERPGMGLVPPGMFIPAAESTGLIAEIGEWVLNEACKQVRIWTDMGLGRLKVAVNVSAWQFRQGLLEQQVNEALLQSGCDPHLLELELTESTLMVQPEEVTAVVLRLKQRGVQLSIDDFGTGYSSLAYLRKLAVDKIKIDQSFVRDLTSDPDGAAIVRAVIQMARSLGLRTLGEGVETQVNRRALQVLGCDYAQGYFFGKPMPADEFVAALKRPNA
jgi:diguanylate cyclase (GGDEF)-like protein/PAS domain S-box-containing protein